MNDSMAQPGPWLVRTDAPGWKIGLSWADQKPDDAVYFSQRWNSIKMITRAKGIEMVRRLGMIAS
jgi:hypothetical protein